MKLTRNINFALIVLILVTGATMVIRGARAEGEKMTRDIYALTISPSSESFDDDTVVSVGGGPLGGTAVIMINKNPISVLSVGGKLLKIQHWLNAGNNKVTIAGIFDRSLYLKVIRIDDAGRVIQVVGKAVFSNPDTDGKSQLEFAIPDGWSETEFTKLEERGDGRDVNILNIKAAVRDAEEKLSRHEGEAFSEILNAGKRTWLPKYYGVKESELSEQIKRTGIALSEGTQRLEKDETDLQIVYGSEAVLVWRSRDEFGNPVMFNLIRGIDRVSVPALSLRSNPE